MIIIRLKITLGGFESKIYVYTYAHRIKLHIFANKHQHAI